MKQLIKELFVLMIIMPISLVVLFFAMQKIEQSRQVEELKATIEKKELVISSPVFGSIEEFLVEEGDIVKEDQTIGIISVIDRKETSQLNSDVYQYRESDNTIVVKSPTEAVVSAKELAEKSTIKPEGNIVTLHPLENTVIKIQVNSDKDLKFFEGLYLSDSDEKYSYPLTLSKRLPATDKTGNTFYYATLQNPEEAREFYNNQKVVVKVKRADKALTGKIETFFVNAFQNIKTTVGI